MYFVIYFESLIDKENIGFFQRFKKVGFWSVNNTKCARRFKTNIEANNVLKRLKKIERKYYNFKILKMEE